MSKFDLSKTQEELTNIAEGLGRMQGMACMAELLFAIVRSKHVCVSQDYFSKLKKNFDVKDYIEISEKKYVYKLKYNKVIKSKFDLIAEYIDEDHLYLIKSIEAHGLTYTCDETVPRLIIW